MPELFIPGQNKPDLLGTIMQFKQLQQGQQRLGLLQKEAEQQTQELVRKQRTEKINYLMNNVGVFKDRESVGKNINELAKELGLPALSVPQDPKEMIREANDIRKFIEANPNSDPRPLIHQFSNKYASLEGRQSQLDLLGKDISSTKTQLADNTLSLILGSGGVKDKTALLQSFAQSGGTPELRSAATNRLMEQAKLAPVDTNASQLDVIAKEFGLPNAASADPKTAIKINNRLAELTGQKAGEAEKAKTDIRQGLKLNQQLSVDESIKLGMPYGSKVKDAIGRQPMTTEQRETLNNFTASEVIIDDISRLSDKVNTFNPGPLGLGRLAGAAANTWGSITQTNKDAALLDSKVGELSLLVRGMGEKGTLATKDVDRVAKLVPDKTDTKGVAKEKIRQLKAFISDVKDRRLESFIADLSQIKQESKTEGNKISLDEYLKSKGQ